MHNPSPRNWSVASAWDATIRPGRYGRQGAPPRVRLEFLASVDLSTLIIESGQEDRFATFVRDRWGFDVPAAGRATFRGGGGLIWAAPGQWLALAAAPGDLEDLPVGLAGIAAVTEQGDGRALVKVSGDAARHTLQKGLAIDLDPTVFKSGHTAVAALAHLSVQIWQTDNEPTYWLAAGRSVSNTIRDWLTASAAEFGYEIVGA